MAGGCATPFTAAEVNESAIDSYAEVTTLKMDMDMNMDMTVSFNGETQNMLILMNGTA
jgi:hypothetical protein